MSEPLTPLETASTEDNQENGHGTGHDVPDVSQASPLTKFFFLNTVFAILLCVLLVIGGLLGAASMVKEGEPDINIAIASVQTVWGGADPETIENQVTDKVEKELKSLKGLKDLSSASFEGMSLINVEFSAESPVNESIALVRAEVDEAKPELPSEAEQPKVEQVSVQDTPILTIGLFGDIDMAVLSSAAQEIEDLLEKVPNVRKVDLVGEREEVIHVQLNPYRMLTLGISSTQVSNAIQNGNRDTPWDQVESDEIGTQVRLYGRYRTLEDLRSLPVTRLGGADGRVVLLGEIAEVRRDLERERNRAFISS
ncbi:MAG: efflux RND transporter permease subunit, partial [Symploca sp. SIO2D2]|nr:efflux RND transporter permease subunit [Symploca sp. SIO2D2]